MRDVLEEEDLFILEYLCRKHKFKADRSMDSKNLETHFRYKYPTNIQGPLQRLKNLGYIVEVKKNPVRYYAVMKYALPALKANGIDVPMGKKRPL